MIKCKIVKILPLFFNIYGRSKQLLTEEIDKLQAIVKIFSFNKENRKNKAILKTMKSIVTRLEELEKIKLELPKIEVKAVSHKKEQEPKNHKESLFLDREQILKKATSPTYDLNLSSQTNEIIEMEVEEMYVLPYLYSMS